MEPKILAYVVLMHCPPTSAFMQYANAEYYIEPTSPKRPASTDKMCM